MKKVVFTLIDTQVKDCFLYESRDGLWIINPDTKEWIIHIGPPSRLDYLWYNYEKFKSLLKYASLDIFKHKYYIKDWVEDKLKLKIGNYHPNITPGEYDWSDDFKPEEAIKSGIIVRDFL